MASADHTPTANFELHHLLTHCVAHTRRRKQNLNQKVTAFRRLCSITFRLHRMVLQWCSVPSVFQPLYPSNTCQRQSYSIPLVFPPLHTSNPVSDRSRLCWYFDLCTQSTPRQPWSDHVTAPANARSVWSLFTLHNCGTLEMGSERDENIRRVVRE